VIRKYNKAKERKEEIHIFLAKPLSENIVAGDDVLDAKWFPPVKEAKKLELVPGFDKIIFNLDQKI